ncbi:hypothetical protein EJF36_01770 [Bacillus sp. HMF5848]|uniref:CBO0543 family protein n=1 Tax=Bacillus sp. HMF5848 TaxID=2495421 RepID=UPI000F789FEC|nr:CBO0543 family protein [Bacillus sp. HMF5848]RSK25728.1 hypothetical protein EJF36_01770 [Bacillus sp. HMF5848]
MFYYKYFVFSAIPVDELIQAEQKFYEFITAFWNEYNYLTPQWWLLVFLSVISPFVWYWLIDKKRVIEITCFGLFYGVAAIILDSIGSSFLVWAYPVRLTPHLFPQLYPYDVGIVIIPYMLVYQRWGGTLKRFFIPAGLMAAFLAFIAEPFMEWLGIYKEITWKNIYSFPIYWLLGIICWAIIHYFKKLERR